MNALIAVMSAGLAFAGSGDSQTVLRGTVKETLDAGSYTYVLIATKEGDRWAAIVKTALKQGSSVAVMQETEMQNFDSKILGRKFDKVAFGVLENAAASDPHAGLKMKAVSAEEPGKPLEKAAGPNGRTVAEAYAQKNKLKGKEIQVRGRVVKYNSGIMGSNWMHLRDGSGTPKGKDNDIVVTTQDTAAIGDVVTVRGTLTTDKDLGAGYLFPALIEKAEILR